MVELFLRYYSVATCSDDVIDGVREISQSQYVTHNFKVMLRATCFDPLKGSSSGHRGFTVA
jgi:GTP-dependent phosphoenolpyruvate carboxykinase